MHQFKELKVWQKARLLVQATYQVTQYLPKEELFGLNSQIRRCAVSIPANIAEGCGRNTNKDLCRFLDIANGSTFELETLLILCADLKYIEMQEVESLNADLQEVQKMLYNFKASKQ